MHERVTVVGLSVCLSALNLKDQGTVHTCFLSARFSMQGFI